MFCSRGCSVLVCQKLAPDPYNVARLMIPTRTS